MSNDKRYKFSCYGYKYAPEQLQIFNHGRKVKIDLSSSMIPQRICWGYFEETIPELKREVRKQQKKPEYYWTLGFEVGDDELIYPTYAGTLDRFDLKYLLQLYKDMKTDFERRGKTYKKLVLVKVKKD